MNDSKLEICQNNETQNDGIINDSTDVHTFFQVSDLNLRLQEAILPNNTCLVGVGGELE